MSMKTRYDLNDFEKMIVAATEKGGGGFSKIVTNLGWDGQNWPGSASLSWLGHVFWIYFGVDKIHFNHSHFGQIKIGHSTNYGFTVHESEILNPDWSSEVLLEQTRAVIEKAEPRMKKDLESFREQAATDPNNSRKE